MSRAAEGVFQPGGEDATRRCSACSNQDGSYKIDVISADHGKTTASLTSQHRSAIDTLKTEHAVYIKELGSMLAKLASDSKLVTNFSAWM